MQPLDAFLARVRELPKPALAGALATIAVVAIVTGAIAMMAHVPRAALFAGPLHSEQLAEVQERLAEWNVPFTPAGDNVVVEAARRNDILLRLSLAGVPHAHVATTAEALANVGVLTPASVVDAQARAGLAGEIELGLRGIDGIDDAHVIIAPARAAEFADETSRDASASVALQLHPGARLATATVAGIRAFVAASVAGLDPSHVTVLDERGIALGSLSDAGAGAGSLQTSLQSALDTALGTGVAIVRVHAEYGRAASEVHEVRRVPVGDLPIERSSANESYDDGGKHYRKAGERDDRGSDTRDVVSRTPAGAIVRLSTAVFIDAGRAADIAAVRTLAAATVGYDPHRGDTLSVAAVNFHHRSAPKRDPWFLLYGAIVPLLPTLAVVAGALIALHAAFPPLLNAVKGIAERAAIARASKNVAGFAPAQVRGALAHEPPHAAAAIISALPTATAAAVLELYPAGEREAIVRRMQRAHSCLIPDATEVIGPRA